MSNGTTASACADRALIAPARSITTIVYPAEASLDQSVSLLPAGYHRTRTITANERFAPPADTKGTFVAAHRGSQTITINLGDCQ